MDYSEIKDLIKTVENSNMTEFELKIKGGVYIRISKAAPNCNNTYSADYKNSKPLADESHEDKSSKETLKDVAIEDISEPITIIPEDKVELKEGNIVTSPMVGTFYQSSSPDKPPFVKLGDKVKKGDVLCVLEAMKIMNEITSAFDGEIVEIMVENEDMVEYDQPLFRIV